MKQRLVLVALLLIALSFSAVMAGCSDELDRANKAMDEANAAVDKANELDNELSTMLDGLTAIDATNPKDAKSALEVLGKAKDTLVRKNRYTDESIETLSSIADMGVSADYKTYVEKQIRIAELQRSSDELGNEMLLKLMEMYQAGADGKLNQATLDRIATELDEIFSEGEAIDAQIITASDESETFFNEKGLE